MVFLSVCSAAKGSGNGALSQGQDGCDVTAGIACTALWSSGTTSAAGGHYSFGCAYRVQPSPRSYQFECPCGSGECFGGNAGAGTSRQLRNRGSYYAIMRNCGLTLCSTSNPWKNRKMKPWKSSELIESLSIGESVSMSGQTEEKTISHPVKIKIKINR